jgi:hypothetical protein
MQETKFEADLQRLFPEELADARKSRDIYRALCNRVWTNGEARISYSWRAAGGVVAELRNSLGLPRIDEKTCGGCGNNISEHRVETYEMRIPWSGESVPAHRTFCQDGEHFIPGYTGREDYLDFYCSGEEGEVAPWIRERLSQNGYHLEESA